MSNGNPYTLDIFTPPNWNADVCLDLQAVWRWANVAILDVDGKLWLP